MKTYQRYLIKEFFNAFAFAIFSFLMVRLAVEIFEHLSMLFEYRVTLATATAYFANRTPYFFIQLLPLSTLMATLYTLTKMAKTHELTALRAAGVSPIQAAVPFLLGALLVSAGNFILDETIVPPANARARIIEHERIRKTRYAPGIIREHFAFRTQSDFMVYAALFNGNEGLMTRPIILRLDETGRPAERWDAERAKYEAGVWQLFQGYHRTFGPEGERGTVPFERLTFELMDPPTEFSKPLKRLDEMNIRQARQYIEKLSRWGVKSTYELVHFYLKWAFPLANVILCLLGIPLAFLTGRRMGVMFSFSLSVMAGFVYWSSLGVGVSLGKNGVLPPLLAAWLGNIVFGAIGTALLYVARR